jgi:predicted transcriptional regulator
VDGASDDETVEIAVLPFPAVSWLLLVAIGTAVAAGLSGATERARFRASQLFLVPLYARLKKDELLEQEKRGMIRGYILVHPGDSYSDIKRNLGLPSGTLTYHLGILEHEGIVRSRIDGKRRRFFPREARLPENGGAMHEVQLRLLRAVRSVPGLTVTDIAGALGIGSQLTLYHLRDLASTGAVRFERRGLRLRCYAPAGEGVGVPRGADASEV